MIIQTLKDVFTGEFSHRNDYKKRPPWVVQEPPPPPPSEWRGKINIDDFAAKYWTENTEEERAYIKDVFGRCLDHELGAVGKGIMWLALQEIEETVDNPFGTWCIYRTKLKRLLKFGYDLLHENDPDLCCPDFEVYRRYMDYDLMRMVKQDIEGFEVLSYGVFIFFSVSKMAARDVWMFEQAIELVEKHKKKSIYNQIAFPFVHEEVIEIDVIKQQDIDEKVAEIEAKNIDGIIYYAEDIDADDIENFVKTYGSKHLLSYADGSNIGIVVLKPNGTPWRNFLGLRAADLKVIQTESENS